MSSSHEGEIILGRHVLRVDSHTSISRFYKGQVSEKEKMDHKYVVIMLLILQIQTNMQLLMAVYAAHQARQKILCQLWEEDEEEIEGGPLPKKIRSMWMRVSNLFYTTTTSTNHPNQVTITAHN